MMRNVKITLNYLEHCVWNSVIRNGLKHSLAMHEDASDFKGYSNKFHFRSTR